MDLYELYFSPTGGTKKAADILSDGLSAERVNVDLTDREFDPAGVSLSESDTAVTAMLKKVCSDRKECELFI